VLRELQEALRGCLADLRQGVGEIRAQLGRAVAELRDGAEPRSLAVALENLQGFFALLAQMNESFEGRSLPALDRLDAAVSDGAGQLEASLDAGAAGILATGLEEGLLAAFDVWPAAAEELELAIGALAPDFLDAGA
jgi:ABC-type transporter Mla subunit MlaD